MTSLSILDPLDEETFPDEPVERAKFMIRHYFYVEYETTHMIEELNKGHNVDTYEPFKLNVGHRAQAEANAERMLKNFEVAGLEVRIKQ